MVKLPFAPKELIEFYDKYIGEKGIVDKVLKRRIWWAMFYCAKEGRDWDNILCEHRKTTGFGIMGRCFSCPHYERFLRMMDEEDEKEMDEIDRLRKEGYG